MKISRLFEIVYILLNEEKVKAKDLANKFEVTTRTIYRDVETLSLAGIPIYTIKGRDGGIALTDNFVLNKSLVSDKERNEILMGLEALDVSRLPDTADTFNKMKHFFGGNNKSWIDADFSSWGGGMRERKIISAIREAILEDKGLEIIYYNSDGEKSRRKIKPIKLFFKEKSWYLNAFCYMREEERFFKITRIKEIDFADVTDKEDLPIKKNDSLSLKKSRNIVKLKLLFSPDIAFRIIDEYDETRLITHANGSIEANVYFPEDEWVYSHILSFGNYVKVLEPKRVADIIKQRLIDALNQYN